MPMTPNKTATRALMLVVFTGCYAEPPAASPEDVARPGEPHVRSHVARDRADAFAERARFAAGTRAPASGAAGKPLGLAAAAAATPDDWRVALDIAAADFVSASVTPANSAAAAVRTDVGVIKPIKGANLAILSTGSTNYGLPGAGYPEPGTDIAPPGVAGDKVTLALTLKVPDNANRLSLQYNFLSAEAPDFKGSVYNDTFSIQVVDGSGTRDFAEQASVNSSTFIAVSDSRAKGSGFDIYTDDPDGVDTEFNSLTAVLPLLPDAGLTDFQVFSIPVIPGDDLELLFTIQDNGDGILDSAVLIDAVQFSALEAVDAASLGVIDPAHVDGLVTGGDAVRGAAADGVAEVILRIKTPGEGCVEFSVPHSDDGTLSTIGGTEQLAALPSSTVRVGEQSYALAVYRAPANFNRSAGDVVLAERTTVVTASYTPPGETCGSGDALKTDLEFRIRRPPVVLARGLWTSVPDWYPEGKFNLGRGDEAYLVNNQIFAVSHADSEYACNPQIDVLLPGQGGDDLLCPSTGDGGGARMTCKPDDDAVSIGVAAKDALGNIRRLGIAASQVDVVAHGEGGIRARKYIASALYKNEVHRLITLNTPHFGALVANQIAAARDTIRVGLDSPTVFACKMRASATLLIETPVDPGDIDDATRCRISLPATAGVPSHAIIGSGGGPLSGTTRQEFTGQIEPRVSDRRDVLSAATSRLKKGSTFGLYTFAFDTRDHDLFADVDSQGGGIADEAKTEFAMADAPDGSFRAQDSDHFRSMRNRAINLRVQELLNSRIAEPGSPFAEFPASVDPACAPADEPPAIDGLGALAAEGGTIRIVSPADGAEVLAGTRLQVQVVAEGGFVPRTVTVATRGGFARSDAPPFTMELEIPDAVLGPVRLSAIAVDDNDEEVLSRAVFIHVRTASAVTAVRMISQNPFLYAVGSHRRLTVVGDYADQVSRDITSGATGTAYSSSDPAVVTVSSDGLLTAVATGVATVVARNGNRQDSTTVTVNANARPVARPGANVALVCVPPGATVPVQLDGSASFDPDGDPISFAWLEAGVELASGATPTVGLTAGHHTIELVLSDGISSSAHATVEVSILADSEPPELRVVGANPGTVECGDSYDDAGASATDTCDGDLTQVISSVSHVNAGVAGSYAVDYEVHDKAGLTAMASRLVSVADRTPPRLTIRGDSPRATECGVAYHDEGAAASDRCDGDLTGAIRSESHVNSGVPGSYAVDYLVEDRAGLAATASRSVQVNDTAPPQLAILGSNPARNECGVAYHDEGAAATDVCDGDLTAAVVSDSHVNASAVGSYTVDYAVRDRAGLAATASRSVSVADRTPPQISILGDNPRIVECGTRYHDDGARASDLCSGDLTNRVRARSHVSAHVPGSYTVDYHVRDRAGLVAAASRSVVVVDRLPPSVSVAPTQELGLPDDRYRSFDLSDCADARDACSGALNIDRAGQILAIHSDEPDVIDHRDPANDIVISSNSHFKLRKQSNPHGNGRVYEIEFVVRDELGNASPARSCFIAVNARSHRRPPVNDGRVVTVRP